MSAEAWIAWVLIMSLALAGMSMAGFVAVMIGRDRS